MDYLKKACNREKPNILLSRIPIIGNRITLTWEQLDQNIVLGLRLPRVCLGMVVGASLAVCGVTMQALVRNNLADLFILGVSSGAAAFATLSMLFGVFTFLGTYALSISAFLGAAITIVFVYVISRVQGRINITQLLLLGVAVSMIMDGVTSMIKLGAPNALGLHKAEFWMSGSLAGAKWVYLKLPFVVLVCCMIFLMMNYRGLNLLLLGDESAGALGINVRRLQKELVLVASLMAGVTIAVSGTIGFVGLMVPPFYQITGGWRSQEGVADLGTAGRNPGGVGGCGGKDAVDHVSLQVQKGEFVGLIGPNGSGKSTVLKNIYRGLIPDQGTIELDEENLLTMSYKKSARKMAVVGQEHMGMEHMAKRNYLNLSGGEKQRVLIARAIAQESDFLILDEPTNHLDISYQMQIFDFIKRLNVTVLSAIHDLNLAVLYCDRLYVLKNGRVVLQGTPEEVLTSEHIYEVYGVRSSVSTHPVTGKLAITYLPEALQTA